MSERKRLEEVALLPKYQGRETVDQETIDLYRERLKNGEKLPPITVANVDGRLVVVDGWHTWNAHHKHKSVWIDCVISDMTENEATAAALTANQRHGLNRSNADKERAIRLALSHPTLSTLSLRELAKALGIARDTITRVANECKAAHQVAQKTTSQPRYQDPESLPKATSRKPAARARREAVPEPPAPPVEPGAEERAQVSEVLVWAREFHRRLAGVKEGHPVYAGAGSARREVHVLVRTCEAAMPTTCPQCGGDGSTCTACGGRGWVTTSTAGHMQ